MEALQQIVRIKLKTIQKYSQLEELTTQQLLKEKKRQSSNDIIQSRLLQTILGRRIEEGQAGKFYDDSLQIMRIYQPHFYPERSNRDIYASIVGLYAQFFAQQGCTQRASEIMHIYKKKVCDTQVLVPNIFSWFVQWTKKKYCTFLKEKIQDVNSKLKVKEGISPVKRNFSRLDYIQEKVFDQEVQNAKNTPLKNRSLAKSLQSVTQPVEKSILKQTELKQVRSFKDQKTIITRQIIYGVFYDEIASYYQSYSSVILDLDIGILRSVKKNDSKKESLKKRLEDVSKVLVRSHQYNVKKVIDQYSKKYAQKFPQRKSLQLKTSQSNLSRQIKDQNIYQNKVSPIRLQKKPSFLLKQKLQPICLPDIFQQKRFHLSKQRQKRIQSKLLNLQLPQIEKQYYGQNHMKNLNYRVARYKQRSYLNYKRSKDQYSSVQDISLDLNKEIRQINQILRVNKAEDQLCYQKQKTSAFTLKKSQRTSHFSIQSTHQRNMSMLSNLNIEKRTQFRQKNSQNNKSSQTVWQTTQRKLRFDGQRDPQQKEMQPVRGVFDLQFRF